MREENPFSPAFPVSPEFFLNRRHIIDSFRKAVKRSRKGKTPTPDNLAILGKWGMGKTSIFRKFESILSGEEFADRRVFFTTIEITPRSGKDFPSFIFKLIEDVHRNFNTSQAKILPQVRKKIKKWSQKNQREKLETSPSTYLRDILIDLWEILQEEGIDSAILMLDDLHYLTKNHPECLYDLWSVFQSLPKYGCNFILCTSGKEDTFSEISSNEPIRRFFNLTYTLSPFQLEETKNVIVRPILLSDLNISMEEEVVKKIHKLTQGHPFFIQFIMRELLSLCAEKSQRKITPDFFSQNYSQILEILENEKFERELSLASDKEKKILLEMATLQEKFSPSEIPIKNARTHLRFLLKKKLIIKHDRGKYSLYHPLFRDYLRKKTSHGSTND